MNRTELTLVVAGVLVTAFVLGWIFALLTVRLNAQGPRGAATRRLVDELQAAEAGRRAAEARLAEVEADLGARLARAEAGIDGAARPRDRW